MENKEERQGVSEGVRRLKMFRLTFTHCSRRIFLCIDGFLDDKGHGIMYVLELRRLYRYVFSYLS